MRSKDSTTPTTPTTPSEPEPAIMPFWRTGHNWPRHSDAHRGPRPRFGERAAETARDALGSWPTVGAVIMLVTGSLGLAVTQNAPDGAACLALVLAGLTLVAVLVGLMAARRADRNSAQRALHQRTEVRRMTAAVGELRVEVERLRSELLRLAARAETLSRPPSENGDANEEGRDR